MQIAGRYVKRVCLVGLLLAFFFPLASALAAGIPSIFSYQGRLANQNGDLLTGSYYFKFSIWNNSDISLGTKLWPTNDPTALSATVRQGVFNVNIGDTANGYPDVLDYNFNTNQNIYLQIAVSSTGSSFQTLSPRQRISSAVFAQLAGAVSGSTTPSSFGTTTPFGTSVVSIEATSTNATPLSIRGIFGQLADLFQIQDSTGTKLFVVNSSGSVGVGTTTPGRKFDVSNTSDAAQLRLGQTGYAYGELYADVNGDVQLSSNSGNGGNFRMQNENLWVCSGGSCDPAVVPVGEGNIVVETALIFDNKFKFKLKVNPGATTTTVMLDSLGYETLEFDESQ